MFGIIKSLLLHLATLKYGGIAAGMTPTLLCWLEQGIFCGGLAAWPYGLILCDRYGNDFYAADWISIGEFLPIKPILETRLLKLR